MLKRTTATALAILVVGALAGCNGEEDFSGATLTSPILGGQNNDPLDPEGRALEVELVAGNINGDDSAVPAIISNIGYRCGNISSRIPGAANVDGFEPFRARCPISARSIEFFLGDLDEIGGSFSFGSATLPVCSGRSAEVDADANTCTAAEGYFQLSVADLNVAPFRRAGADAEVYYRAAWLATLDGDEDTDGVIEIPDGAHEATSLAKQFPESLFDSSQYVIGTDDQNYDAFQSAWEPWFDSVAPLTGQVYAFPGLADAVAIASEGSNRVRAGLWTLVHNTQTAFGLNYALAFSDQPEYNTMSMTADAVVLPDGTVLSLGIVTSLLPGDDQGEVDLLALDGGASVDELLFLGGAPDADFSLRGLFEPSETLLDFSGRVLGVAVYDGLEVENASGNTAIDFEVDYPSLPDFPSNTLNAVNQSTELGRVEGTVFSTDLPSVGFQAQRAGLISGSLDERATDLLPPFYRLTLKQGCADPAAAGCEPYPFIEAGVNYPSTIGGVPIVRERPRDDLFGDNGYVQVQLLDSGLIVTDVDRDCRAVDPVSLTDGDATQEYLVGFVSRSEYQDGVAPQASANILLFLVGDGALSGGANQSIPSPPYIPQFGSLISGRIDLDEVEDGKPLFRLSDERFNARIRAIWTDNYQPIKYVLDRDNDLTNEESVERVTLISGSIDGVAMAEDPDNLGTCIEEKDLPTPP